MAAHPVIPVSGLGGDLLSHSSHTQLQPRELAEWVDSPEVCALKAWEIFILNPGGDAVLHLDCLADNHPFASPILTV